MITITCLILWMPAGGAGFLRATEVSARVAAPPLEPSAPAAKSAAVTASWNAASLRRVITDRI